MGLSFTIAHNFAAKHDRSKNADSEILVPGARCVVQSFDEIEIYFHPRIKMAS